MARKQLTLTNPHNPIAGTQTYRLEIFTVDYTNNVANALLKGDDGRLHRVSLVPIPNTTQEQALLALINKGVLAGTIADAPVIP